MRLLIFVLLRSRSLPAFAPISDIVAIAGEKGNGRARERARRQQAIKIHSRAHKLIRLMHMHKSHRDNYRPLAISTDNLTIHNMLNGCQ